MDIQKKDKDFSKFFHNIIDSGAWAKWSPKAKAVYPVLLRWAKYDSRKALPTIPTIAKLSGVSRDSVTEGTKEIICSGYLSKKRGNSTIGFRNIYTVFKEPQMVGNLKDAILRGKTVKCKTKRDPKTRKFISSRKDADDYLREKAVNDTLRQNNGRKENLEILNRDTSAGSASACLNSQAEPAFKPDVYKGHTIETQTELELLIEKYGEALLKLIRQGDIKLKEDIKLDEAINAGKGS